MDLYGSHFEYAGQLSRKYGLIIASVNTKRNTSIHGKVKTVDLYNNRNHKRYHLGTEYSSSPLSFDMEVVAEGPLSGEQRRDIQKWLFNHNDYQKLYIDPADEILCGEVFNLPGGSLQRTYLNCKFINPSIIEGNGGIIGYQFTVECDSHMAWNDPSIVRFDFSGDGSIHNIAVCVDTDQADFTYPKLTITTGQYGGTVEIINNSDDDSRTTSFDGIPPGTTFSIAGTVNYVSDHFFENFKTRNFPRLLDGTNDISIKGDVTSVEFEWQNMRYL